MIKILIYIALTILSGILYRMGGSGRFSRMAREIGVPLVMLGMVFLIGILTGWLSWVLAVVSMGIMVGAISTYHYFLPKPVDYTPFYYGLHGFMTSLAMFPLMIYTHHWIGFGIRVVVCTVGCFLADVWLGKSDVKNEFTRGAIINGSLILLII